MISIRAARRAGVPLVVVETADPQQTITTIVQDLNGKFETTPIMVWDIVRALVPVNEAGRMAIDKIVPGGDSAQIATQNPTQCLAVLEKAPPDSIIFFMNAHRYWENEMVMQAIWNLRDVFKSSDVGAMLVMLAPSSSGLPLELKNDAVVLTDELPDETELGVVVDAIAKAAKVTDLTDRPKIVDTLTGLSAFAAEQVLAMSIDKGVVDRVGLWEKKRKTIEQTRGLSVWRGGERFSDVGGYENVKDFCRSICTGRKQPKAIVFIDEIEKSMAGSGSDTSGVSQDQLRTLLTFMQDEEAAGLIFIGPPGSGKSAVAKATGNEVGIPTIALDLGAMKGSLVGESERSLRSALQVVKAVSQGEILFIATCNSIGILPPELRRRFSLGTFFFGLPTAEDRAKIWEIYRERYELGDDPVPEDAGWTGAEIRNCCSIAWRLGKTLREAAGFIVPVSVSAAAQIEKLCKESHRRYISASAPGLYEYEGLAIKRESERRINA